MLPKPAITPATTASLSRTLGDVLQVFRKAVHVIWWRYLKWPMPLWRLRGHGIFSLAGERFAFYGIADSRHAWWAFRARERSWEPEALNFFAKVIHPGDVVFDIGAYIGPYALLASRLAGPEGHVYAFEPDAVARKLLARNVEANGAKNVTVVPCAVSDVEGMVRLQSSQLGNATTSISVGAGMAEAEAVTLRSFCEEHSVSPSVMKIDVEGWEAHVLSEEARPLVAQARATVVEVHEWQLQQSGKDPAQFMRRISDWGRELVYVDRRPDLEGSRYEGNYTIALI
jgi:FkbM family methyltransferase